MEGPGYESLGSSLPTVQTCNTNADCGPAFQPAMDEDTTDIAAIGADVASGTCTPVPNISAITGILNITGLCASQQSVSSGQTPYDPNIFPEAGPVTDLAAE
jgi:hypothetical protein